MRGGARRLLGVAVAAVTVAVGVPGAAQAVGSWTVQPVPLPSGATTADVTGVSCTSAADCEAVMNYNQSAPAAEVWNGSSWTAQTMTGVYEFSYPESVSCGSATSCMAAGYAVTNTSVLPDAEVWNGTSWAEAYPIQFDGQLFGVSCPSATSCVAVGYASTDAGSEPSVEKWNGRTWKVESIPEPTEYGTGTLSAVSCVTGADCVAVGETGLSGAPQILAYRWDGTSWTQQTMPAPAGATDAQLNGVSCTSASLCTAVGNDITSGGGGVVAEHWNGSTWAVQDLPLPAGTGSSSLASISCVAARCTAAGLYVYAKSKGYASRHPLAEFFNGTSWKVLATAAPADHQFFTAISCVAASTCTAVGSTITSQSEGQNQPLAEQE